MTDTRMIDGSGLRRQWKQLDASGGEVQEYIDLAETASAGGEPLLSYDIARGGLTRYPDSLRLLQIAALAQARSGSPRRAADLLELELSCGRGNEDTYGITTIDKIISKISSA